MAKGKQTCKILKEIRKQIAEENDINLVIEECTYKGDCLGTCPRCEAEVRYLERELEKRQRLGKAAVVAGLSVGLMAASQTAFAQQPDTLKKDMIVLDEGTQVMGEVEDVENEVYTIVEQMPSFQGGLDGLNDYIVANLKYPQKKKEQGIQGRVFVKFVIEPDGSISNAAIFRSVDSDLDTEALRVVESMPKWNPGKQRGRTVRVSYILPVVFNLADEN